MYWNHLHNNLHNCCFLTNRKISQNAYRILLTIWENRFEQIIKYLWVFGQLCYLLLCYLMYQIWNVDYMNIILYTIILFNTLPFHKTISLHNNNFILSNVNEIKTHICAIENIKSFIYDNYSYNIISMNIYR